MGPTTASPVIIVYTPRGTNHSFRESRQFHGFLASIWGGRHPSGVIQGMSESPLWERTDYSHRANIGQKITYLVQTGVSIEYHLNIDEMEINRWLTGDCLKQS